ncbi:MAG: hypothetical protein MHM6MM_004551 [Cercozoa sp. M6MM]
MLLVFSVDDRLLRLFGHVFGDNLSDLIRATELLVARSDKPTNSASRAVVLGPSNAIRRLCGKVPGCSVSYVQLDEELHRVCKITQLFESSGRFYEHIVLVQSNLGDAKAFQPALQSLLARGVNKLDAITSQAVDFPLFRRIFKLTDLRGDNHLSFGHDTPFGGLFSQSSVSESSKYGAQAPPLGSAQSSFSQTWPQPRNSQSPFSPRQAELTLHQHQQYQQQHEHHQLQQHQQHQQHQLHQQRHYPLYKQKQLQYQQQQQQQRQQREARSSPTSQSSKPPPGIQIKSLWAVRIKVPTGVPNSLVENSMKSCGRVISFSSSGSRGKGLGKDIRVIFLKREYAVRAAEQFNGKKKLYNHSLQKPMSVLVEANPHYRSRFGRKLRPKEAWLLHALEPATQTPQAPPPKPAVSKPAVSKPAVSATAVPTADVPAPVAPASLLTGDQVNKLRLASTDPIERKCLQRACRILLHPNPDEYLETEGTDELDHNAMDLLESADAIEQRTRRCNALAWINVILSPSIDRESADSMKLLKATGSKTHLMMTMLSQAVYYVHFRSSGAEEDQTKHRASESEVCEVLHRLSCARGSANLHSSFFKIFSSTVQNLDVTPREIVEYAKLIGLVDSEDGVLKLADSAVDVMKLFLIPNTPEHQANSCVRIDAFLMKEYS